MSTDRIDLEMVLKRIMAHVGKNFPNKKLENRLLNLGLAEFVGADGVPQSSAVLKYGFPFKFNNQLDEGILVLAHFLDRFKKEGGSLEIYAINKLSKGQEKDLSFWHDAKARLYLELQNIILLLDKTEFARTKTEKGDETLLRKSRIRRIFTFGELSDLAFLSQAGINVLGEQLAANIDVGFLFLKTFAGSSKIKPLNNTLIINYRPQKAKRQRHNFFELYGFVDDAVRYDLPYKERCSARWFTKSERKAALKNDERLKQIVRLFTDDLDNFPEEPKKWEKLGLENSRAICRFEQNSAEFFNDAMLMMYKAYEGSETSKDINNGKFIIDRINGAVITRDMIRLQRAMSSFGNAIEIRAVDATSTKNSLNVHESSPVYRDWLRRSLNRVLRSTDKTLHRIYILNDDNEDQDKDIEYQTLLRLMQFYRDYFHYEVSEMKEIVERHAAPGQSSSHSADYRKWFEARWKTFENRVEVHVTTSTVIEEFAEELLRINPAVLEQIFRNHMEDEEHRKKQTYLNKEIAKLDYLYARYERSPSKGATKSKGEERMIYNFLNPRADTGELRFPAFTYRDSLSTTDEKTRLFDFLDDGELGVMESAQEQHRVNLLAVSLLQYADTYQDILKDAFNEKPSDDKPSYRDLLTRLREERKPSQEGNVTVALLSDILDARGAFEQRLYNYFKPHFDYLNAVLEFMSLKVDFWENINTSSVRKISPFRECQSNNGAGQDRVKPFTDFLIAKVRARLDDPLERIPRPEDYVLTSMTGSGTGGSEHMRPHYNVFLSYKWISPIKEWVEDELYKCLRAAEVTVLWDEEAFEPGEHSISEMERGVEQSSHMLSVITPEYFGKGAAGLELKMAQQLAIEGKEKSLILMVLRETDIPLSVRGAVIIDWTDPRNHLRAWRKLLIALEAPNPDATPPGPLPEA